MVLLEWGMVLLDSGEWWAIVVTGIEGERV